MLAAALAFAPKNVTVAGHIQPAFTGAQAAPAAGASRIWGEGDDGFGRPFSHCSPLNKLQNSIIDYVNKRITRASNLNFRDDTPPRKKGTRKSALRKTSSRTTEIAYRAETAQIISAGMIRRRPNLESQSVPSIDSSIRAEHRQFNPCRASVTPAHPMRRVRANATPRLGLAPHGSNPRASCHPVHCGSSCPNAATGLLCRRR